MYSPVPVPILTLKVSKCSERSQYYLSVFLLTRVVKSVSILIPQALFCNANEMQFNVLKFL